MSEYLLSNLITYNPTVVQQDVTLREVFELFDRHQIRHLPVVDDSRRVVGMLSMSDVHWALDGVKSADPRGVAGESTLLVRDVMDQAVTTVASDAEPNEPLQLVLERGMIAVPVVNNDELVGMITATDFLREYSYCDHASFRDPVSKHMIREIAQIDVETSPHEALRIMTEQKWEHAAVAIGDCPVGILSRRDFCGGEGHGGTLAGLYLPDVPSVLEGESLGEVIWHMIEHGSPALAVVDRGNRLTGILTQETVLRAIEAELASDATV